MNIRQLRYFSTIAEEGQITKAAKKLFMAQPPLSQQLKLLEQELDVKLLQKHGRQLELTEAGQILYEKAKQILLDLDDTVTEVSEMGKGLRGMLALGSVKTCFHHIPERMRWFRNNYPNVHFKLLEGDTYTLQRYLRNRDIEFAIVRLPLDMSDFIAEPLQDDQFVVVLPLSWDVTTSPQDQLTLKQISEMPMMLLHRAGVNEPGLYELVLNNFEKKGLHLHVVCDSPDAAMILALVKAGVGGAILPKSTLKAFSSDGIRVVEIKDAVIKSESAVIWLKERYLSNKALRFIETFKRDYDQW